tara:strand:- start:6156 stop:6386 length:231 start_codon:yes stop_codon:yes gene_type:complete
MYTKNKKEKQNKSQKKNYKRTYKHKGGVNKTSTGKKTRKNLTSLEYNYIQLIHEYDKAIKNISKRLELLENDIFSN